jgi:hypothetical protein
MSFVKEAAIVKQLFEIALAKYCAPVLLGRKPAALFAKPLWWDEALDSSLAVCALKFLSLNRFEKNTVILAYVPPLLSETLERPDVYMALESLGYPARCGAEANLRYLEQQFREQEEFPHEVGFFLGYPPPDVVGFMRNRGSHCKLCGLWKVYSDVKKASLLFAEYTRCRQRLLEHIQRGGTIFD